MKYICIFGSYSFSGTPKGGGTPKNTLFNYFNKSPATPNSNGKKPEEKSTNSNNTPKVTPKSTKSTKKLFEEKSE
jgi:hypothetical protein